MDGSTAALLLILRDWEGLSYQREGNQLRKLGHVDIPGHMQALEMFLKNI